MNRQERLTAKAAKRISAFPASDGYMIYISAMAEYGRRSILAVLLFCTAVLHGCVVPFPHWTYEKPEIKGYLAIDPDSLGIYAPPSERSEPLPGMSIWQVDVDPEECELTACGALPENVAVSDDSGAFELPPIKKEFNYFAVFISTTLEHSLELCLCFKSPADELQAVYTTELLSERYPDKVELSCELSRGQIRCDCCEFESSKFGESL